MRSIVALMGLIAGSCVLSKDISIVWPSAYPPFANPSRLEAHLLPLFQKQKLNVFFNWTHLCKNKDYFANTLERRASYLEKALEDPSLLGIIAGRGGYGLLEILSLWDHKENMPGFNPKWVVGFSDTTYLFLYLWRQKNFWPIIHGVMPCFNKEAFALNHEKVNVKTSITPLLKILSGEIDNLSYTIKCLNPKKEEKSINCTTIKGGNLSILVRSLSSPTSIVSKGSVLFIEDVGTTAFQIQEMLISLHRAGVLKEITGLLVGDLDLPNDKMSCVLKAIVERMNSWGYAFPIFHSPRFGHGDINDPLPMGFQTQIHFSKDKATFTFDLKKPYS